MALQTDSHSGPTRTNVMQTVGRSRLTWSLGSLVVLVIVWEVAALWLDSRLFPGPLAVLSAMISEARSGALAHHVGATLARVVVSFVIAMLIGSMIGIALAAARRPIGFSIAGLFSS